MASADRCGAPSAVWQSDRPLPDCRNRDRGGWQRPETPDRPAPYRSVAEPSPPATLSDREPPAGRHRNGSPFAHPPGRRLQPSTAVSTAPAWQVSALADLSLQSSPRPPSHPCRARRQPAIRCRLTSAPAPTPAARPSTYSALAWRYQAYSANCAHKAAALRCRGRPHQSRPGPHLVAARLRSGRPRCGKYRPWEPMAAARAPTAS